MKISIVIVNWNRSEDTIECLKSLEKISYPLKNIQIILVDNNSDSSDKDKIKKYFTKSKFKINNLFIENVKNYGFAAGNNIGIKAAVDMNSQYVLLINNDTYVKSDFLEKLESVFKNNQNIAAVSPKIYFAKGFEYHKKYKESELSKVIWYAGGEIDWKNVYANNVDVDKVDTYQNDENRETEFATGACVLYSTKAILNTGFFDENYFMYFEDTDLSVRFKKNGWKIMFCPKSIIWHKVAQSSGIGSGLNDYFLTRNRIIFAMKYANFRAKFAIFREALKLIFIGRKWQRIGVMDYFFGKNGRGSWI